MSNIQRYNGTELIDLSAIEKIHINTDRKATVPEKKKLNELMQSGLRAKRTLIQEARRQAESKLLIAERDKSEYKTLREKQTKLTLKSEELSRQAEAVNKEIHMIGFQTDGSLFVDAKFKQPKRYGNYSDSSDGLTGAERAKAKAVVIGIEKKIEAICIQYDTATHKLEKIEAKLWLCETIGDLASIIDAVIGNGDSLLR